MNSSGKLLPLLKPKHFEGLTTKLANQGLRFSTRIGHTEREEEIFVIGDGNHEVEDRLDKFKNLRPYTKIKANPRTPSARSLMQSLHEAKTRLRPDESFSLSYGLPNSYSIKCDRQQTPDGLDIEGQYMVLVALNGNTPVGFAGIDIELRHDIESKQIVISQSVHLVYVSPAYQGQSFGIDLSIACGHLCQDVLVATYRAAASNFTITPIVNAVFETAGGERFTQQLVSSLEFKTDILNAEGRRKSIKIERIEIDADY